MIVGGYPEYIDAASNWLKDKPAHWTCSRLKFFASVNMGQSPNSEECNNLGIGRPFLQGNAEFGVNNPTAKIFCDNARKVCSTEDLLFSVRAPVGALNIADQEYGIGRGLCAISVSDNAKQRFLYWLLHWGKTQLSAISSGSTFEAVSAEDVNSLEAIFPPLEEQKTIARFLGHETAKIDRLIAKQERLIELLKEKRQAVISHAVTKGLNPDAKMKDSGVEWLGEVPVHWTMSRISWASKYISYGFTNPMPTSDQGPYMLTANDIDYGRIKYESARKTEREAFEQSLSPKSKPRKDDILITKDGTLGRLAVHDGQAACINQSVALLRVKENLLIPEFASLILMSSTYQDRMIYEAGGTTIKHIYISRLAQMPIAFPCINEQSRLINYANARLAKVDNLISKAELSVPLMRERRSALISAAVTGKIDVRDWQPQREEAEPENLAV